MGINLDQLRVEDDGPDVGRPQTVFKSFVMTDVKIKRQMTGTAGDSLLILLLLSSKHTLTVFFVHHHVYGLLPTPSLFAGNTDCPSCSHCKHAAMFEK